jgi:hypothetical protein
VSAHDDEQRLERLRRQAALGGLTKAARMSPAERSESARKAGLASAAARKAAREAARARGEVVPEPRPRPQTGPTIDELSAYLEQIDAEGQPLTYEQRIREARLRLRQDIARQTLEAFKGGDS